MFHDYTSLFNPEEKESVVTDCHTHCLKAVHWGDEYDRHWRPAGYGEWPDVTPETYLDAMRAVDRAIVFGLSARRVGVYTPNEFVADFCRHAPEKLIGFMTLEPTDPSALSEMERSARELGLRGIKLYPVLQGFDPGDSALGDFYQKAMELKLVILWHFGATPSPRGFLRFSQPILLDDVAREFPTLTMIIAHMAHPWTTDTAVLVRKNRRLFADVSGIWARPNLGVQALISALEWGVTDKLLFGSDYPLWTPEQGMKGLRDLCSYPPHSCREDLPAAVEAILASDAISMLELS